MSSSIIGWAVSIMPLHPYPISGGVIDHSTYNQLCKGYLGECLGSTFQFVSADMPLRLRLISSSHPFGKVPLVSVIWAVFRLPLHTYPFSGFATGHWARDQHLSMLLAYVSRRLQQSPQLVVAGVLLSSRLILRVHPFDKYPLEL